METLVYTTLVSLLSVLAVQTIVSLSKVFKEVNAARDIENSAIVALDRIAREIRLSDALGSGSVFGTSAGKLVLNYSGAGPTTREFSIVGDVLHLYEDSVDQGELTSPNVAVTVFHLDQATSSGKIAVRITLTLKDKRAAVNPKTATFYSAAAMRGLY